jgi:DNA invertase Pin-like site-specific DNA recombinase
MKHKEVTMLKKAIIYCRSAATEQQRKNLAILKQKEVCQLWAQENKGFQVVGTLTDAGRSKISKKQLLKLLQAGKSKGVTTLITYGIDRLSRNLKDYQAIQAFLDEHKIELVTVMPDPYEIKKLFEKAYKEGLSRRIKRGIAAAKAKKIKQNDNEKQKTTRQN